MTDKPVIYTREYYERLFLVEERHWWCLGMREIAIALLRARLGPARPRRVLDAGCGSGVSLVWLEEFAAGGGVHGIDLSREALLYSWSRGKRRLALASVLTLPFRSETFDLALSADVIQHVPRGGGDVKVINEAFRVLRPGGVFFLRTNCEAPGRRNRGEFDDFHFYTERELRGLFERAGFQVTASTHSNMAIDIVARVKGRLGEWFRAGAPPPMGPGLPEVPRGRSLIRSMLLVMLRAEAWLIARGVALPVGSNIVIVGRKPGGAP
ncbi:MAG: class I SAM-dependent methyltransferase [bacterium]